jgi:hypothetical protein
MEQSERDLRNAVEQRRFDAVNESLRAFCARADTHLAALPAGSPERSHTVAHVIRTLEWSQVMLSTTRAGYADDLRRISSLHRYLARTPARRSRVQIDL